MMKQRLFFIKLVFLAMSGLLLGLVYSGSGMIADGNKARAEERPVYLQAKEKIIDNYASSRQVLGAQVESGIRETARYVPILLYHGILEKTHGENLSWDEFWEQMTALKEAGWRTVGLAELAAFNQGEQLPAKSFVLTFDDGRRDSAGVADKVLEAVGFRAVMFVIAEEMGRGGSFHLTKAEIRKMADSDRWEIGSHSFGMHQLVEADSAGNQQHALTHKLWLREKARLETDIEYEQRIWEDLTKAKTELEEVTGKQVAAFAFPFGDYGQGKTNYSRSEAVIRKVTGEVYDMTFYQGGENGGWINYPDTDTFMQRRIGVEPGLSAEQLFGRMESEDDTNGQT